MDKQDKRHERLAEEFNKVKNELEELKNYNKAIEITNFLKRDLY